MADDESWEFIHVPKYDPENNRSHYTRTSVNRHCRRANSMAQHDYYYGNSFWRWKVRNDFERIVELSTTMTIHYEEIAVYEQGAMDSLSNARETLNVLIAEYEAIQWRDDDASGQEITEFAQRADEVIQGINDFKAVLKPRK